MPKNAFEDDLFSCRNDPSTSAAVAFVSKMFAVPRSRLPGLKKEGDVDASNTSKARSERRRKPVGENGVEDLGEGVEKVSLKDSKEIAADAEEAEEEKVGGEQKDGKEENDNDEILLGFARLFSGTLTTTTSSTEVYALLPKYNTALPPTHPRNQPYISPRPVRIKALYEMMGRDLIRVESVKAGNVFAIEGLEGAVLRSGTLCEARTGKEGEGEGLVNLASLHNAVSSFVFSSFFSLLLHNGSSSRVAVR